MLGRCWKEKDSGVGPWYGFHGARGHRPRFQSPPDDLARLPDFLVRGPHGDALQGLQYRDGNGYAS